MRVRVLLFSQLRLAAQRSSLVLELEEGASVGTAVRELLRQHPALGPLVASCMTAVGLDYASGDQPLVDGDEISLIPPVQGG